MPKTPPAGEVKVERLAFLAALERVKPAIQSSGSIPQLKHVWFDADYVYAYNGAMGIRLAYKASLKPCGVPGAVLLGLLNSSSAKEVMINQEPHQIGLKMGRSSVTIPTFPADANPWNFPEEPKAIATLGLTPALCEGLRKARIIKASNPTYTRHYGIILFPAKDELVLYSTDDRSLAEVPVKVSVPRELSKTVLPFGFVNQLLALETGKITFAPDAMIAESERVRVCSNVLDSSNIDDISKVADSAAAGAGPSLAFPEGFDEAMDRALVLVGDLDKHYISLKTSKKELELTGKLEHGLLDERFPLTGGEEGSIRLGLGALKGLVKEAVGFSISKKALLLYGKDEALYMIASYSGGAAVAKEKEKVAAE